MNSDTLRSMIHYIYTGELADGWQDLDVQDVTTAADMYDLPGWIELFPSTRDLTRSEEIQPDGIRKVVNFVWGYFGGAL